MKEYLGDGVYAEFVGGAIILTTENGEETFDTICIDQDVFKALARFAIKGGLAA